MLTLKAGKAQQGFNCELNTESRTDTRLPVAKHVQSPDSDTLTWSEDDHQKHSERSELSTHLYPGTGRTLGALLGP